jgi:hypothetical protein
VTFSRILLHTGRFYSFTLLVLVSLEASLIMVFSDTANEESMAFKKDVLEQFTAEYCKAKERMDAVILLVDDDDCEDASDGTIQKSSECMKLSSLPNELKNSAVSLIAEIAESDSESTSGSFSGFGSVIGSDAKSHLSSEPGGWVGRGNIPGPLLDQSSSGSYSGIEYVAGSAICECKSGTTFDISCLTGWWDDHFMDIVYAFFVLVAIECWVSYFAWIILDSDRTPGSHTAAASGAVDNVESDAHDREDLLGDTGNQVPLKTDKTLLDHLSDETTQFFAAPESRGDVAESEKLVIDTWYFEACVCFSVALSMYVLALDSPADPPLKDDALVLRILEVFVTVFLTFELLLGCVATWWAQRSNHQFRMRRFFLNFWTLTDVFVLFVSWLYLYSKWQMVGVCRALRVVRPMRTVRIFESVQIVGRCIADDAIVLRDVLLLTMSLLFLFSLIGLTCFHGSLQYTCVEQDLPAQDKVCGFVTTAVGREKFCYDKSVKTREQMNEILGVAGTEHAFLVKCPMTLACNSNRDKYCVKLEETRALGDDESGLRGFDNLGQALHTMVVHMSGDNGIQAVPFGLVDAEASNSWFAWSFFALTEIVLCFVILNLLLAVCCAAFSQVAIIMKERAAAEEKEERTRKLQQILLQRVGDAELGIADILRSVKDQLPQLADPFHGSSATHIEMVNKTWKEPGHRCGGLRERCHALVMSTQFRPWMSMVVVAYSVVMMLYSSEMSIELENALTYAETVLLAVFIAEVVVKLLAFGWRLYMRNNEYCLDLVSDVTRPLPTCRELGSELCPNYSGPFSLSNTYLTLC